MLANLFLNHGIDRCMTKRYPQLPFERFDDDAIVYCRTEGEPKEVWATIAKRMKECGLSSDRKI